MNNKELSEFIEKLIKFNELNKLPEQYDGGPIFSDPVIGVAKGDDPIFQKYVEIIPRHFTPETLWITNGLAKEENMASKLRIVSIVFPFVNKIREDSMDKTTMPAEIYCVGRNYANALIFDALKKTINYFSDLGYLATSGMLSDAFNITVKYKYPYIYSNWSERHIAFAAGLGTFSLHEGLITEVGCNIRLGSVLTNAPLKVTPRKSDNPYANCLYYAKGTCKKCKERCPAGAITENSHDKYKCQKYGRVIAERMDQKLGSLLKPHYRRINGVYKKQRYPPVGCAFCQFNVPCMNKNPVASEEK